MRLAPLVLILAVLTRGVRRDPCGLRDIRSILTREDVTWQQRPWPASPAR